MTAPAGVSQSATRVSSANDERRKEDRGDCETRTYTLYVCRQGHATACDAMQCQDVKEMQAKKTRRAPRRMIDTSEVCDGCAKP